VPVRATGTKKVAKSDFMLWLKNRSTGREFRRMGKKSKIHNSFSPPLNESYILFSSLFSVLHDHIFLLPFDDGIWEEGDCDRFFFNEEKVLQCNLSICYGFQMLVTELS